MKFLNLVKLNYWFSNPTAFSSTAKWIFFASFLILFVIGLVLLFLKYKSKDKINKEIFGRFSNLNLNFSVFALLLLFFRQEKVFFFSWRFWYLILIIPTVFYLVKLLIYNFKRVPQIKIENKAREEKSKYLPPKN